MKQGDRVYLKQNLDPFYKSGTRGTVIIYYPNGNKLTGVQFDGDDTIWYTVKDSLLNVIDLCAPLENELGFDNSELDTIRFCVSKMLEVNKLEHGEMCASILTGAYDRTEEFQRVLTKLSTLK